MLSIFELFNFCKYICYHTNTHYRNTHYSIVDHLLLHRIFVWNAWDMVKSKLGWASLASSTFQGWLEAWPIKKKKQVFRAAWRVFPIHNLILTMGREE